MTAPGLKTFLDVMPLLAILRGITPEEVEEVGEILVAAGIRGMEVPLNAPQPFESLRRLVGHFGDRALVGAGTVRTVAEVQEVARCGGRLVVMPHTDPDLIRETVACGMEAVPGCATPTEAFRALDAGASALKLFPAEALPPSALKALLAVLPPGVPVLPVGSIRPENIAPYWMAGARGFGLGTGLYQPGRSAQEVDRRARRFVDALQVLRTPSDLSPLCPKNPERC